MNVSILLTKFCSPSTCEAEAKELKFEGFATLQDVQMMDSVFLCNTNHNNKTADRVCHC